MKRRDPIYDSYLSRGNTSLPTPPPQLRQHITSISFDEGPLIGMSRMKEEVIKA